MATVAVRRQEWGELGDVGGEVDGSREVERKEIE